MGLALAIMAVFTALSLLLISHVLASRSSEWWAGAGEAETLRPKDLSAEPRQEFEG